MLVDHANKTVINGARVLAMDELLDFATPEERLDRIEDFIDRLLTLNPKITQGEIYDKIRKQRAYIKKGVIYFDGQTRPLKPFMAEASTGTTASHGWRSSAPSPKRKEICSVKSSRSTVRIWLPSHRRSRHPVWMPSYVCRKSSMRRRTRPSGAVSMRRVSSFGRMADQPTPSISNVTSLST